MFRFLSEAAQLAVSLETTSFIRSNLDASNRPLYHTQYKSGRNNYEEQYHFLTLEGTRKVKRVTGFPLTPPPRY